MDLLGYDWIALEPPRRDRAEMSLAGLSPRAAGPRFVRLRNLNEFWQLSRTGNLDP